MTMVEASSEEEILALAAELRSHLATSRIIGLPEEWFQEVGELPVSGEVAEASTLTQLTPSILPEAPAAVPLDGLSLEATCAQAKVCVRCRLAEGRTNVVFGAGNTDAPPILFVGEGPGADEDRTGEPFVGRAGQLLTSAITKGLSLKREDVYICNVVKCRPPENRAPLPDEVASCIPYLYRQIELIRPQVIVTLGAPAQLALSGVKGGITKIRGQWQEWRGIPLMPTYHPAYILRNPAAKRPFWEDLQEVMKRVEQTKI